MSKEDLDQLRLDCKKAIDEWVDSIRAEEALATSDHSMVAMEHWDSARFREHAHTKATEARRLQGRAWCRELQHLVGSPITESGCARPNGRPSQKYKLCLAHAIDGAMPAERSAPPPDDRAAKRRKNAARGASAGL